MWKFLCTTCTDSPHLCLAKVDSKFSSLSNFNARYVTTNIQWDTFRGKQLVTVTGAFILETPSPRFLCLFYFLLLAYNGFRLQHLLKLPCSCRTAAFLTARRRLSVLPESCPPPGVCGLTRSAEEMSLLSTL